MPRVLLVTAGSHGDVFPFLGVGRALTARGAEVAVLVNPYFQDDVAAAGLRHLPLGERLDVAALIRDERMMDGDRGSAKVMQMLLDHVGEGLVAVQAALDSFDPDVVVAHHICLGARWVLSARAISHVGVTLSPLVWLSGEDPVPVLQKRPGRWRAAIARAARPLAFAILGAYAGRRLNRLRVQHGYPAERDPFLSDWHGGDLLLGLWSPVFRPPTAADPPRSVVCGFPFYDGPPDRDLGSIASDFLADGPAPIVFSLGTTAVHVAGDFYERAVGACRRLRRRGLLLMGEAAAHFEPGGSDVLAVDYAPLSRVAPSCAATVVHGGIGSVSQALRAGRPTLVVPFAHDQFHNALHVRRLGVGDTLPITSAGVDELTRALRPLLDDPEVARSAAEIGARLREERGADQAAERILSLVGASDEHRS